MRQLRFWYGSQPFTIRSSAGDGVVICDARRASLPERAHLGQRRFDGAPARRSAR